jgi:hypothetical protein
VSHARQVDGRKQPASLALFKSFGWPIFIKSVYSNQQSTIINPEGGDADFSSFFSEKSLELEENFREI